MSRNLGRALPEGRETVLIDGELVVRKRPNPTPAEQTEAASKK
jgi:hypothetical protein